MGGFDMGLFGDKEKCCICKENVGKKKILDGYVCLDCIQLAGPFLKRKSTFGYEKETEQEFLRAITKNYDNQERLKEFHETGRVANNTKGYLKYGDYLKIDDVHSWWFTECGNPQGIIFDFSEINDFEIIENGRTISKTKNKGGSGVGRAVVGGALFGPAGAIVGATTKKKKAVTIEKELLSNIGVRVTLKNKDFPAVFINVIIPCEVTIGSIIHESLRRDAEEVMIRLRRAQQSISVDKQQGGSIDSPADEIMKYKQLLDMGAITQEEFEAKKKQLLRL